MRITPRDRWLFKFEKFIARGKVSLFLSLVVAFTAFFLLISVVRILTILIFPDIDIHHSILHNAWVTYLQMTDPGSMNLDSEGGPFLRIFTIISGFSGLIIFSILIAFITTFLERTLYNFRKGRSKILEQGHTLLLGWNDRVIEIIEELIEANESEQYASIVILADRPKDEMEDAIIKNIPSSRNTEIFVSSGDPGLLNELYRVNAAEAKSAIVLSSCTENADDDTKEVSDIQVIKIILALVSVQDNENKIPIIAELFQRKKRDLLNFFNDDKIICVDSWYIMGKLLLQTTLTSGLDRVYNEILSFKGNEFYFYKGQWDQLPFYELSHYLKDGIPIGIKKEDGSIVLRPTRDSVLRRDDEAIILAEDDSTINFTGTKLYSPSTKLQLADQCFERHPRRMLILGWQDIATAFIEEGNDFLADGSVVDIIYDQPIQEVIDEVNYLRGKCQNLKINLIDKDPLESEVLREQNPYGYDNVIILSQDITETSPDKNDSNTLVILMMLHNLASMMGITEASTTLIPQILNSDNQDLIVKTEMDDFFSSNKLITMILTQLSEQPQIYQLYDDIFQEEGSEIYVKSAKIYFPELPFKGTFLDIMTLVEERNEICLGVRIRKEAIDAASNYGIYLNPLKDKKFTLSSEDFLIVLSEDEL